VELPNPKGAAPGGSRCTATIEGLAAPARSRAKPRADGVQ
jgi:hypothetical protein